MNKKYVHKPTIVTAVQWFKHGDLDCITPHQRSVMRPLSTTHGSLQTRSGPVMVHPGDYVLKDDNSNMWCISEEDFEANYGEIGEMGPAGIPCVFKDTEYPQGMITD